MTGTVVEVAYEKGWGRVRLDDGRELSFDTSTCRAGIPEVGARVTVIMGPSRLGGEKITSLVVEARWEPTEEETAFLVVPENILFAKDPTAPKSPDCRWDELQPGDTGYAQIEVQRGVVGHTTAWMGARGGEASRETRISGFRRTKLTPQDSTILREKLEECLEQLWEHSYNPDSLESPYLSEFRSTLWKTLEIGKQFAIDPERFQPPDE